MSFTSDIVSEHVSKEEESIIRMLNEEAPHLLPFYIRALPEARRISLQLVVMSLLREDVSGMRTRSADVTVGQGGTALSVDRLPNGTYKVHQLSEGHYLCIRIVAMYAFYRTEADLVFLTTGEDVHPVLSAEELVQLLPDIFSSQIALELQNSSANMALSLAYWQHRKQTAPPGESTIQSALAETMEQTDLFFEQLCIRGHNLHPCAKTRIGMSARDVFIYAPEFQRNVPLRFVALLKEKAEWNGTGELYAAFPHLMEAMEQELSQRKLSIEDYVPVPVHPWQLKHVIPSIYEQELKEQMIVPVAYSVPSYATSSFRTVLTERLAVKTALRSQMTSTIRSISPQTANNGVLFSRMIRTVMEREPQLSCTFVPIHEVGGGSFRSDEEEKKRNLSFVLRECADRYVKKGEVAVPGISLYNESLVSSEPVLLEIVAQLAKEYKIQDRKEAAFPWFSEYASIALQGFLTLMVKYGIGLEGHLQNSIPVFQNGRLVRMLFRDWGGARIYEPRLLAESIYPEFYPNSLVLTQSVRDMQNKVFYTVIQNHLGEIIYLLCKHLGVEEKTLWAEVRRICGDLFQSLERDGRYKEAAVSDRSVFFAAETDYKALFMMRLQEGKAYSYAKVDNPLYSKTPG